MVESVLALFEIDVSRRRIWGGTLAELRRVLAADYERPVAQYVAAGELPVAELLRCASLHFPGINREPLDYPRTLARARDRERGLGVAVKLSPFGRPGHPLRGFYHRVAHERPLGSTASIPPRRSGRRLRMNSGTTSGSGLRTPARR